MDDPNINRIWDAMLGEDTQGAVFRLATYLLGFIVLGGSAFWLAD
jgi:hypothetical protein